MIIVYVAGAQYANGVIVITEDIMKCVTVRVKGDEPAVSMGIKTVDGHHAKYVSLGGPDLSLCARARLCRFTPPEIGCKDMIFDAQPLRLKATEKREGASPYFFILQRPSTGCSDPRQLVRIKISSGETKVIAGKIVRLLGVHCDEYSDELLIMPYGGVIQLTLENGKYAIMCIKERGVFIIPYEEYERGKKKKIV